MDSVADSIRSRYTSREWSGEKNGVTVHVCPQSTGEKWARSQLSDDHNTWSRSLHRQPGQLAPAARVPNTPFRMMKGLESKEGRLAS